MIRTPGAVIAVIGSSRPTEKERGLAREVGRLVARAGATLVCGGLGGVMEEACRGASEEGGLTVGILPGNDRRDANPHVRVAIATGMGEARNIIIVKSADCCIAVGGGYGTLSEIALALRTGTPVVGLETWRMEGREPDTVVRAENAGEAVEWALGRSGGGDSP